MPKFKAIGIISFHQPFGEYEEEPFNISFEGTKEEFLKELECFYIKKKAPFFKSKNSSADIHFYFVGQVADDFTKSHYIDFEKPKKDFNIKLEDAHKKYLLKEEEKKKKFQEQANRRKEEEERELLTQLKEKYGE